MKLIIAGGRKFAPNDVHRNLMKAIFRMNTVTEIVSGGARGADTWGEYLAKCNSIPVRVFKADWDRYGKPAGFIRNAEMAKYADAVVLLPGGRGTDGMYWEALKWDLLIFDYRENTEGEWNET